MPSVQKSRIKGRLATLLLIQAFLVSIISSCDQQPKDYPLWISNPTQKWQPEDPMLQTHLVSLRRLKDGYAVVSSLSHAVYKLNDSLDLIWSFGREGKGPEEFINFPTIYPQGERLYALEYGRIHVLSIDSGEQVNFQVLPTDLPRFAASDQVMLDKDLGLWYSNNKINSPGEHKVLRVNLSDLTEQAFQWGELGVSGLPLNMESGIHLVLPDQTFLWFPDHHGGIKRINKKGMVVDTLPIAGNERYVLTRKVVKEAHAQFYDGNWDVGSWRIFNNPLVLGDYAIVGSLRNDLSAFISTGSVRGRWVVFRWNPELEYIGEWETDPAYGHMYLTFCLASDSLALLAYEVDRGEFHRIPLPKGLLDLME